MKKTLVIVSLMLVMASAVMAGNFQIQYPVGTDLFVVDTSGNVNATTGWIAEGGVQLSDKYCALTGTCDLSGSTVSFGNDQLEEADINFTTSCATGNHLYISGTDLVCEADADTQLTQEQVQDFAWNISGGTQTHITVTYQDGSNNVDFVVSDDWWDANTDLATDEITENKLNFTTSCALGNYLYVNGTDLACEAVPTFDGNSTEEMQDAVLNAGTGGEGINYTYNDAGDSFNVQFDCSEVTNSAGDHLSCSGEDLVVSDDWVNESGDTMTRSLVMNNANVSLTNSAKITGGSTSSMTIDGTGNVVIVLS